MNNKEAIKELEEMYEDGCYIEESLDAVDKEEALYMAKKALEEQEKHRWIAVSERLPKEHSSIFAKFKGTSMWKDEMFEKVSNNVFVTIELKDGNRITDVTHTIDGKWKTNHSPIKKTIIAWMPLPEPYKKEVKK